MSNIKLAFRSYVFGVLDIVLCLEENARNVLTWLCLNQRERERERIDTLFSVLRDKSCSMNDKTLSVLKVVRNHLLCVSEEKSINSKERKRTHAQECTHTGSHARIRAHTMSHTYTRTHAHTHTYTHTHTHTHTQVEGKVLSLVGMLKLAKERVFGFWCKNM